MNLHCDSQAPIIGTKIEIKSILADYETAVLYRGNDTKQPYLIKHYKILPSELEIELFHSNISGIPRSIKDPFLDADDNVFAVLEATGSEKPLQHILEQFASLDNYETKILISTMTNFLHDLNSNSLTIQAFDKNAILFDSSWNLYITDFSTITRIQNENQALIKESQIFAQLIQDVNPTLFIDDIEPWVLSQDDKEIIDFVNTLQKNPAKRDNHPIFQHTPNHPGIVEQVLDLAGVQTF